MDEFFTIVAKESADDPNSKLVPCGCVTRKVAHSRARVPHASVQVIPVRSGTGSIVLHQRSHAVINSPDMWDVLGGHVTFELGILLAENGLEEASLETALREAREEMLLATDGRPHLIQRGHVKRVGVVGQFEWGVDDPRTRNVEYSTAFVLCVPEHAVITVPFEFRDGSVQQSLPCVELSWRTLLQLYEDSLSAVPSSAFSESNFRDGFADGLGRILHSVLRSRGIREEIETAIGWCTTHVF